MAFTVIGFRFLMPIKKFLCHGLSVRGHLPKSVFCTILRIVFHIDIGYVGLFRSVQYLEVILLHC